MTFYGRASIESAAPIRSAVVWHGVCHAYRRRMRPRRRHPLPPRGLRHGRPRHACRSGPGRWSGTQNGANTSSSIGSCNQCHSRHGGSCVFPKLWEWLLPVASGHRPSPNGRLFPVAAHAGPDQRKPGHGLLLIRIQPAPRPVVTYGHHARRRDPDCGDHHHFQLCRARLACASVSSDARAPGPRPVIDGASQGRHVGHAAQRRLRRTTGARLTVTGP
jgi:hypothetical protein